jgi:hypothetical protein
LQFEQWLGSGRRAWRLNAPRLVGAGGLGVVLGAFTGWGVLR